MAQRKPSFRPAELVPGLVLMAAFWALAIVLATATRQWFWLLNFGFIGTSLGAGMTLYTVLPRERKIVGRKLTQFLVGLYMLGFLGLVARENMQLEGFFFYLLAGTVGGALVHYLVAKIVGPLLFGRGWCGWACWTAMVLDLLPFTRSPGRLDARWGRLRYAHFALSLGLVATLWLALHYRLAAWSVASLVWLLAGNLLYFGLGIGLAYALRDNRAFCKYVCPIVVPMKLVSRFSVLKIGGDGSKCTACRSCEKQCPMDVRISDYLRSGARVTSSECVFCQGCLNTCPREIPRITFAFDAGWRERLNPRGWRETVEESAGSG